jgi:hypothetical protein
VGKEKATPLPILQTALTLRPGPGGMGLPVVFRASAEFLYAFFDVLPAVAIMTPVAYGFHNIYHRLSCADAENQAARVFESILMISQALKNLLKDRSGQVRHKAKSTRSIRVIHPLPRSSSCFIEKRLYGSLSFGANRIHQNLAAEAEERFSYSLGVGLSHQSEQSGASGLEFL